MSAEIPLDDYPQEKTPLCLSPSILVDPQRHLLTALNEDNFELFTDLIARDDVKLNHWYSAPDNTTCLHSAARDGKLRFVNALLEERADPSVWSPVRKCTPLHMSVNNGHDACVAALLRHGANVNAKNGHGRTPLHLAAASDAIKNESSIYRQLLSHPQIDVHALDRAGCNALYLAAVKSNQLAANYLRHNGGEMDCKVDGITARELLEQNIPETMTSSNQSYCVTLLTGRTPANQLYEFLTQERLDDFRRVLSENKNSSNVLETCHGAYTCLQYAADNGLEEYVTALLEAGADPTGQNPNNEWTPLHYAAARGYHRILKTLIHSARQQPLLDPPDSNGETLLHKLVKREYKAARNHHASDHDECFRVISDEAIRSRIDVNGKDNLGYTPLHHAVTRGNVSTISALLHLGANIGIKNKWGETPVKLLPCEILEEYLNKCVEDNGKPLTDWKFQISLNYSFLAPRRKPGWKVEDQQTDPLPETESLWYMAQSSRHCHLLIHPVITSFLDLKWQKIRKYFWVNLLFYLFFVIMLTLHLFLNVKSDPGTDNQNSLESPSDNELKSIYYITSILVVLLFFREFFQFFAAPRGYGFSFENWLEVSMLSMAAIVLFTDDSTVNKRHLSALIILASWIELVMLGGRHPFFSLYVTMFTTVVKRFTKFLMWYFVLIVAFALSFYILFRGDDAFHRPDAALIKTLVMTIGEMDYGDLPIIANTPTAQIIFLTFLFLITIVLMNLLNGLAVNDTGEIQQKARIVGYTSRVKLICYIESMLLGDPFSFLSNYPPFKWAQKIPDCTPCRIVRKLRLFNFLKWCGGGTLLFFAALPKMKLTIQPNRRANRQVDESTCKEKFDLDQKIVDDARNLVLARRKPNDDTGAKLEALETKLNVCMEILRKLSTQSSN